MKSYIIAIATLFSVTATHAQDCTHLAVANNEMRLENVKVERAGNFLTLAMDLNLDSLRLPSNTQLVYTPILHTTKGDTPLPEVVVNGRKQQVMYERGYYKGRYAADATVLRRYNGKPQKAHYLATIPMDKSLNTYEVRLHEDLCGCGNREDGTTYTLKKHYLPNLPLVRPQVEAVKIRHLDKRAYIDFPVDQVTLYPNYRRNPAQLDSIISTIIALKADKNLEVSTINIHGYASPESPYDHNAYLATNRAKTLTDFVRRQVNLPASLFTVSSTAEDWDGLVNFIKNSNLEHKSEILAIASDTSLAPDAREARIKQKYADEYKFMLSNWYPALRHSDYHITYKVKPFDVETAKQVIKTQPQLLSEEEMFMVAQTYEPGSKDFNDVMQTAIRLFPNNATANLNTAIVLLNEGKADDAKPYLDKAGNSKEAQQARQAYEELKK
jgi:hypothetical protein